MMQAKPEDMKISPPADNRIPLDVIRIDPMGNGKVKVKIKQTQANLIDMRHQGRDYIVIRNLGRGRYIMRLLNTEMTQATISIPERKFPGGPMQIDRYPRP
jgi:hypothetical protein